MVVETPRPRNYIEQKYQEIRSLPSALLLLFSTEIMGRVLPLYTTRVSQTKRIYLYPLPSPFQLGNLDPTRVFHSSFLSFSPFDSRFDVKNSRRFTWHMRIRRHRATCHYLLRQSEKKREVGTRFDGHSLIKSYSSFLFQMETQRERVLVIHGRGAAEASSPRTADTRPHTWPNQPIPCIYPTTPW